MSEIESFFTRPGNLCEIEDRIVQDINNAESNVFMAVAFTNNSSKIIQAINSKNTIHVKIVVNINKSNPSFNTGYIGRMKIDDGCMHNKFIIIDNKILWTGSFNMTSNAAQANFENALRITEPKIINDYIMEFHRMYFFAKAIEKGGIKLAKSYQSFTTTCEKCNQEIGDAGKDFNIEVNFYHEYEHASVTNQNYIFNPTIDDTYIDQNVKDHVGEMVKLTKDRFVENLGNDAHFLYVSQKYTCYCNSCKPNSGLKGSCTECGETHYESDIIEVNEFDKVKYFSKKNSRVDSIEEYHLKNKYPHYPNPKGLYYRKICLKCVNVYFDKTFD